MKFLKILSLTITVIFAAYSLNACGGGSSADIKAKLTFISGTVESMAAGASEWKAMAVNSELSMSDTVKTGEKSSAKIDFSDGVKIFIEENTSVKLKEIKKPSEKSTLDIVVEIIKGAIFFDVTKRENSKFEMETSTAVAGVKGTKGIVSFKDDKTLVMVTEGRVEVSIKKAPVDKVMLEADDSIEFGDVSALTEKAKIDYSKVKFSGSPLMKTLTPDDLIKKVDVIKSNN
ncbi:MAG TPA: FecR family protein [Candidatus Wallbacteria bacterium]|nr:FecR family protein [Candidatus Wallbacteria bacterium]